MKITIIAVGNLRETYFRAAAEEYLKRLSPYAQVAVVEVAEETAPLGASPASEAKLREKEGQQILKAVPAGSLALVLAIEGRQHSSEQFAAWLEQQRLIGRSHISFIIGGSTGLSEQVKAQSAGQISFGALTLPHQLARIVLLEQIYRAFRILRNEPYHK